MKKLKIYLDTSVVSFVFADDSPDFKKVTEEFFKKHINNFSVFVSDIVLLEINKTPDHKQRENLLNIIDDYRINILDALHNEEINRLAKIYLNENAIPLKKNEDALHVATSTVYEMDILRSWNFRHLANIKRQMAVNSINEREGYLKRLNLLSPLGVDYED